ncbi:MAG: hypothetical protein JWR89_5220 [Tardiphaga sp.]|jgi:hypothetical protein|uniref:hypothetical protein n=1 Tax=Tardiphaga sp. TaxID=1926292 RepID=UPI002629FEE5|nr:hypothetical protein [Tardiphaga sp.]MDB5505318.1 hypothetical protein [Tardiphaga sp.]
MTDNISATFETRRAAELAIEHLVQEHGVPRTGVSVDAEGAANSSGTERSGADDPRTEQGADSHPKLAGAIKVSVRGDETRRKVIEAALQEAGGQNVG